MQFMRATGRRDKIKNRGGRICFEAPHIYRRHDRHYQGERKSRKDILKFRRLRTAIRSRVRDERSVRYGVGGVIFISEFILISIGFVLLLMLSFL